MNGRATLSLIQSGRWATGMCLAHGVATVWVLLHANPPEPPLWATWAELWVGPGLLLLTQVALVAGLLFLCHALRHLAGELSRGGDPADLVPPPPFHGAAVAVAMALGIASGIWAAARSWLGPLSFALWIWIPAILVLARGRSISSGSRERPTPNRPRAGLVSRLRGMSLAAVFSGFAVVATSGSLAVGSLLPFAMLQELPYGPAPRPATWPVPEPEVFPVSDTEVQPVAPPSGHAPTALQVGEAVQVLIFTGSPKGPAALELPPVRRHEAWWNLDSPPTLPVPPHRWADRLIATARSGAIDAEGEAFMERMSTHPANAEFDRLEGAPAADIAGTRWRPLLERPVSAFELPVPRYVELWNGVRGRVAGATYVALHGDPSEARRRLATVVQLGRLLYQDGPLTLDALLGAQIANEGTRALEALTTQPLEPPVEAAATGSAAPTPREEGISTVSQRLAWLRGYEAALRSPEAPRGLQWEAFTLVNSFLPCATPHNVLWGPADAQEAWRRDTRTFLVRRPSEQALSTLLEDGYLGTRASSDGWGWLPKVLEFALSGRPAVTHCAPVVAFLAGGP